jgi:osmoprotectant transport system substrate-binding protein
VATKVPGPSQLQFVSLDAAGPATFTALDAGEIDAAVVFGTQAELSGRDLVRLDDDRHLFVVQNLVPVVRAGVLSPDGLALLNEVSSRLTDAELIGLNHQVAGGGVDLRALARGWIADQQLAGAAPALSGTVHLAALDNPEAQLVAYLYAAALLAHGMTADVAAPVGGRAVVAPQLDTGKIDLMVEYVGAYLIYLGRAPSSNLPVTLADLRAAAAARGLAIGDPTPGSDTDTVVVRRVIAESNSLERISDLAALPGTHHLAGPPQCATRPLCLPGLRRVYQLTILDPADPAPTTTGPAPTTSRTTVTTKKSRATVTTKKR